MPEPNITSICVRDNSSALSLIIRRFTRCVIVQKSRSMVAADRSADIELTIRATLVTSPKAKLTKKRAASMKIGLPGGCPTSSLQPCEMNSGQSQKLAVGSTVRRYVTAATAKHTHPKMSLMRLYRFNCIYFMCFIYSIYISL